MGVGLDVPRVKYRQKEAGKEVAPRWLPFRSVSFIPLGANAFLFDAWYSQRALSHTQGTLPKPRIRSGLFPFILGGAEQLDYLKVRCI